MKQRTLTWLTFLALAAMADAATAAETATAAECANMQQLDCRRNITMSPAKVKQCVHRGYDAPKTCRKDEGRSAGVRTGGSSGFSYGTIQAPENSAGMIQAPPSLPNANIQLSFGHNWWSGLPCTLPGGINLCSNGTTPPAPPANLLCPAREDNTGHYGIKYALSSSSTSVMNFECGGALPLTTYETVLNKTPDRLASTEYGSYYLWLYKKGAIPYNPVTAGDFQILYPTGTTPPQPPVTANPIPLPRYLCTNNTKTADLPPPIAQMITYQATATNLVIRLKSRSTFALEGGGAPIPLYVDGQPEKYLILPIVGGQVRIPADCSEEATYYKTLADANIQQPDMVIESAVNGACEGPAQICAGLPAAPTSNINCDVVNLLLSNAEPPAPACVDKTQYVILDRPNLVYPPGASATMTKVTGRTAVLAPSLTGSRIFTQQNSIIRLGPGMPYVTFNEGGFIKLADDSKINIYGVGSLEPATKKIAFTSGGNRTSSSGAVLETFTNGQIYTIPNPVLPLTVHMHRSMTMPPNYLIPTQPAPYAQAPAP